MSPYESQADGVLRAANAWLAVGERGEVCWPPEARLPGRLVLYSDFVAFEPSDPAQRRRKWNIADVKAAQAYRAPIVPWPRSSLPEPKPDILGLAPAWIITLPLIIAYYLPFIGTALVVTALRGLQFPFLWLLFRGAQRDTLAINTKEFFVENASEWATTLETMRPVRTERHIAGSKLPPLPDAIPTQSRKATVAAAMEGAKAKLAKAGPKAGLSLKENAPGMYLQCSGYLRVVAKKRTISIETRTYPAGHWTHLKPLDVRAIDILSEDVLVRWLQDLAESEEAAAEFQDAEAAGENVLDEPAKRPLGARLYDGLRSMAKKIALPNENEAEQKGQEESSVWPMAETMPRAVLFDKSHGSLEFPGLEDEISARHRVAVSKEKRLTEESLQASDVLLLIAPDRPWADEETSIVRERVRDGLRLVVLTISKRKPENINKLLEPFGIAIDKDPQKNKLLEAFDISFDKDPLKIDQLSTADLQSDSLDLDALGTLVVGEYWGDHSATFSSPGEIEILLALEGEPRRCLVGRKAFGSGAVLVLTCLNIFGGAQLGNDDNRRFLKQFIL